MLGGDFVLTKRIRETMRAALPSWCYSGFRILASEMGVPHSWDSWMAVVLIVSGPRGTPRTSGQDGKVTWRDQGHSLHRPRGTDLGENTSYLSACGHL